MSLLDEDFGIEKMEEDIEKSFCRLTRVINWRPACRPDVLVKMGELFGPFEIKQEGSDIIKHPVFSPVYTPDEIIERLNTPKVIGALGVKSILQYNVLIKYSDIIVVTYKVKLNSGANIYYKVTYGTDVKE